ncbi:Piso0_003253 [Millerozyma farinosa CBS 7064]|uniref:Piso0_003253 protein n=1 Tax=Pichia sorbitophila (strain ATCC MYA-4447 / BCRC 22081 / CBS 7064 / NBRC 10061 / NRRL Y-12695) TaxID=559304 RepID=G8YIK7_PICSO|nr:Piso0_003253 [Millerozyma farinosa CBS 7064]CCE80917.1 Piso0_003253 [Millerozyma farinosa CBS 7064]
MPEVLKQSRARKDEKQSGRKEPIPITLLSGFLESGKTTLLEHILKVEHGFKIAVIINDMSKLNIDAELIENHNIIKKEEKLIQLQNGCICCTLRGDLLEELISLARNNQFDYIIIESTGISEPMQVAETFSTEFTETMLQAEGSIENKDEKVLREILDLGGLNKITKLDTCVTVIDALNFLENFETTKFLADRWGDHGSGENERTITDLMVDQLEFSDIIILNKVSLVGKKKLKKVEKAIKALNPVAKIIRADYCNIDVKEVVNTGLFDFEKATTSAGWLQSVNEMTVREGFGDNSKGKLAPKPETEEYGITNFIYKSRRPFHPERLYKLLRDKFFVIEQTGLEGTGEENENASESGKDGASKQEEGEGEEDNEDGEEDEEEEEEEEDEFLEPTEKEIIRNKKKSVFGPLLRSKGFFWLATRYILRGEWSSAGAMLTLKGGIPWFSVTGPMFIPPEAEQLIKKDMVGKHGDRRNEIVFIGLNINKRAITKKLDECLLNDKEFAEFERVIKTEANLFKIEKRLPEIFDDGFEDWILFDEEEDKNDEKSEENERVEKKLENKRIHHNHTHH